MSHLSPEPAAEWLGSRRFWLACLAALVLLVGLVGARSAQVVTRSADPVELHLYGQPRLAPGQSVAFRVLVSDGQKAQPIAAAKVTVALIDEAGRRTELAAGSSDQDGIFVVKHVLAADFAAGDYRLQAVTQGPLGRAEATHAVTVLRTVRILLVSDKPLYQPGQTMHLRALALGTADDRPAAGREIVFEVQDGKGNKVFKQQGKTSQFGIAAADFTLADQVNTGDYALGAAIGGATARRSVTVKTYALPKFRLELSTDRASYQPADKISGEVRAVYTFGKPVAGARVRIIANEFIESFRSFATLEGVTDDHGAYRFSIAVPSTLVGQPLAQGNAFIKLDATVSAAAGGEQSKSAELVIASQPLRIEAVPERGELVRGVSNRIYLVVSTPEGQPVAAQLTVSGSPGTPLAQRLTTSSLGVAHFEVTPDATNPTLALTILAEIANGQRAELSSKLPIGVRSDAILLRPDRAVYRVGETVNLTVLESGPTGRAFIDVVKDRRTAMMHAIDVRNGHGELSFELPPDLTGTLELVAYTLRGDGELVRDVRLIQVQPKEALQFALRFDKPSYAPGATAILDLNVSRRDGTPVAAALGLVGVDEAVYALYDTRPGLEQLYFALQEDLLKPRYELHAHLPPPLSTETRGAEIDEAQSVLLTAAEQRAAIEGWAGTLYRERQFQFELEAKIWFRSLSAAALLAPIGIFGLLFLVCFGYALTRLKHRQPFTTDLDAHAELSHLSGRLIRGWLLGLILPLPAVAFGEWIGDALSMYWSDRHRLSLVCAGLCILIITALLFRAAQALRKAPAVANKLLYRKVVATVPLAYFCGAGGILAVLISTSERGIDSDLAAVACLFGIGLAGIYFGLLSVIRQTALRPVTVTGWFGLLLSRSAVLLLPGLLFLSTMFMAKRAVVYEMAPRLMNPVPSSLPPNSQSVPPLQAPSRVRRHFPETLLWKPEIITDASGRARLEVPLADSITTWRIAASAVSASGELGAATVGLPVFQDFFVDIDFPATLTQHDEVSVPVSVWNYLDQAQTVRLSLDSDQATWLRAIGPTSRTLSIGPKQTTTVAFRVRVEAPGKHTLTVRAAGSALADAVQRAVIVLPDGQPVIETRNGRLLPQVTQELTIPREAIAGANDLYLKIYPGAFSQVVEGLDGIFRMPSGCFEQTSSTTYPSVLALDYLRRTRQTKPDLELKALSYIGLGYQRLLSFEVSGGGFEWFGHPPAHNLLTAYGLLEFHDMAKVYAVDAGLIERTRRFLWSQQHDGRFTPTSGGIAEGAINQYQGDTVRATAYIAWALAEADSRDGGHAASELGPTLDWLATGDDDGDPYTQALRAQALLSGGREAQARPILDRLEKQALREGEQVHFSSKAHGVTHSFGDSMDVETTGLVTQALLRVPGHEETAHHALSWLISKRDPQGTWGSTQPTIAAMRALLGGTEGGGVKGEVRVAVRANDAPSSEVRITPETSDVYRLISLRGQVKVGKNSIVLTRQGEGDLAYQIVAVHHLPWSKQAAKKEPPMHIAVRYDATTIKQDQLLGAHVEVAWNAPGAAQMALVDLGIPPGFEVVAEDLEQLVEKGVIKRFSNTGRQLIVYLSEVAQSAPLRIDYRLRARYPVRVKTPASRAYPYYQPEAGAQADPVELTIQ